MATKMTRRGCQVPSVGLQESSTQEPLNTLLYMHPQSSTEHGVATTLGASSAEVLTLGTGPQGKGMACAKCVRAEQLSRTC